MRAVVSALAAAIFAARYSNGEVWFGVLGGVQLSASVRTAGDIGGLPFRARVSPWHISPSFGGVFGNGLGFKVATQFRRFEQTAGALLVNQQPGMPFQTETIPYKRNGVSWELPLLGCYELSRLRLSPYVEGGVTLNRLSNVLRPFRTAPASVTTPGAASESRIGATFGAGVALRKARLRLAPGLRFTHYGSTRPWLPAANSVEINIEVAVTPNSR